MDRIIVEINNKQSFFEPDIEKIKKITRYVLKKEGCLKTEISILLTDNKQIRQLNKKYRGRNKATDVLAFSQYKTKKEALKSDILGDIVISCEMARKQAKEYNQPFLKEVYLYLIHGLLHLLNYNDETDRDYEQMDKKQQDFLRQIWKREN